MKDIIQILFKRMKITVTDGNNLVNLDVDNDNLIEDVKALL